MYTKRSGAIFAVSSTIIAITAFYICNITKTVLILILDEPTSFYSESSNEHTEITYRNVSTYYSIFNQYDYVWPTVRADCNCSCRPGWHDPTCDSEVINKCVQHPNKTTNCQYFEDRQSNNELCPVSYASCCLIYFSWDKNQTKADVFTSVHLKNPYNVYNVQIAIKDNQDVLKHEINLTIPDFITHIMIGPSIKMKIEYSEKPIQLPDTWYHVEPDKDDLFMENLNTIAEQEFEKMGWFKLIKGAVDSIKHQTLKTTFSVTSRNCTTNPSVYNWHLNAVNYYKDGVLVNPSSNKRSIKEDYEDTISDIIIDRKDEKVILKQKVDQQLTAVIEEIACDGEQPSLFFTATIKTYKNGTSFLLVNLTSGTHGKYRVDFGLLEGSAFIIFVATKPKFPIQHFFLLQNSMHQAKWVCITRIDPDNRNVVTCDWATTRMSEDEQVRPETPITITTTTTTIYMPTTQTSQYRDEEFKVDKSSQNNDKSTFNVTVATLVMVVVFMGAVVTYVYLTRRPKNDNRYNQQYNDGAELNPIQNSNE